MTLARQMYPGKTDIFIKMFDKATKYPYQYLLVDLKPFTPENDRLIANPEWTNRNKEHPNGFIKDKNADVSGHCCFGFSSEHIDKEPQENNKEKEIITAENMNNLQEKTAACDDCGLLFDSVHDVQRHVKSGWCPENSEPPSKKRKVEVDEDSENDDENVDENEGFCTLWKIAKQSTKERYDKVISQLIANGEDEEESREIAVERVQPYVERMFLSKYEILLNDYIFPLENNVLHKKVLAYVKTLLAKGINQTAAIKRTIKKYKKEFQDLFENEVTDDEDSNEEDDQTESESEAENA